MSQGKKGVRKEEKKSRVLALKKASTHHLDIQLFCTPSDPCPFLDKTPPPDMSVSALDSLSHRKWNTHSMSSSDSMRSSL